jgi:hypothetical protein
VDAVEHGAAARAIGVARGDIRDRQDHAERRLPGKDVANGTRPHGTELRARSGRLEIEFHHAQLGSAIDHLAQLAQERFEGGRGRAPRIVTHDAGVIDTQRVQIVGVRGDIDLDGIAALVQRGVDRLDRVRVVSQDPQWLGSEGMTGGALICHDEPRFSGRPRV